MSEVQEESIGRARGIRRWIKAAGLPVGAAAVVLFGTSQAHAVNVTYDFAVSTPDWYCGHEVWTASAELDFQCDGNLVIYNFSGHALWATGTYGSHAAHRIDFSASGGDVELYDSNNNLLCRLGAWNTIGYSKAMGGYADMQDDGNFVIYDPHGNPVWASHTYQDAQSTVHECY